MFSVKWHFCGTNSFTWSLMAQVGAAYIFDCTQVSKVSKVQKDTNENIIPNAFDILSSYLNRHSFKSTAS